MKLLIILFFVLTAGSTLAFTGEFLRYGVQKQNIETKKSAVGTDLLVWKHANSLEIREESSPLGSYWQFDGDKKISKTEIYYNYKTVIHYRPTDALLTGKASHGNWLRIFFPRAMGSFDMHETVQKENGVILIRPIQGAIIELDWDENIENPRRIVFLRGNSKTTIDLKSFNQKSDPSFQRANWQDNFEDLDFADLGDNEAHPLVKNLHHKHNDNHLRYVRH